MDDLKTERREILDHLEGMSPQQRRAFLGDRILGRAIDEAILVRQFERKVPQAGVSYIDACAECGALSIGECEACHEVFCVEHLSDCFPGTELALCDHCCGVAGGPEVPD